jgi:UDP-N-acetylmuramyl tripeptide synthase
VEAMAKVKAVVPETVFDHGYTVLNADDDLVYKMKETLDCNIALFSMDENNPRIKKHCKSGGLACVHESGHVTIMKGTWKITEFPFDRQRLRFSIENSMYDANELVFKADTVGKHYGKYFLVGWEKDSFNIKTEIFI